MRSVFSLLLTSHLLFAAGCGGSNSQAARSSSVSSGSGRSISDQANGDLLREGFEPEQGVTSPNDANVAVDSRVDAGVR